MSEKTKLIAALVTARAAIDSVLLEITEQRSPPPAPEEAAKAAVAGDCQHTNRQHLKTFGAAEHWVCNDCGYEYRR